MNLPDSITCRRATGADIPLLRDLAQRIWRVCYPGVITPEQIEFMLGWMYSAEKIREEMHEGYVWEVVEEDGVAIGFVSFSREDDGRVKLHKMYVLPERQRRGIGQRLLDHVCESARGLGATAVWLQVNKNNGRAIGAYRKAGFVVEREAVFDIGGGYVMDDYLMAKAL